MERFYRKTFYFYFRNLKYVNGRNTIFLCYRVDKVERHGTVLLDKGVFTHQFHPSCHAELRFLSFCDDNLSPDEDYQVTWYLSWSPCPACAKQVADFLAAHRNVRLTIVTARLYYFWDPEFKDGLRRMYEEGAEVAIMSPQDFENCWEDFVFNKGRDFCPWENTVENHQSLCIILQEILRHPMERLDPDTFYFQFKNLSFARDRNTTFLCYRVDRTESQGTVPPDRGIFKNQNPEVRQGLRRLCEEGAQMAIMSLQDYETCWEDFVWNKEWNFRPWEDVDDNYQLLASRLEEILG